MPMRRRLLAGVAAKFYPLSIPYSCRFDAARSCKISRTPGVAGNTKTLQIEAWVKRAALGVQTPIFYAHGGSTDDYLEFTSADTITLVLGGVTVRTTNRLFRDPTQWLHICVLIDTTQATAANRVKIYINGVQETSFGTSADPALNSDCNFNAAVAHYIGNRGAVYAHLYLARVVLISGATPGLQGYYSPLNSYVWVPGGLNVTYGTTGCLLEFANAAALGTDTSGQGNTWTSSGLTSADQFTGTPTNNASTWNPASVIGSATLANGALEFYGNSSWAWIKSAFEIPATGKWYMEAKVTGTGPNTLWSSTGNIFGLMPASVAGTLDYNSAATSGLVYSDTSHVRNFSSADIYVGASAVANGDVISLSVDRDANTFEFRLNNTTVASGTLGSAAGTSLHFFCLSYYSSYCKLTANFGATAFAYTPPTGYKALCSDNFADPLAVILTSGSFTGNASADGPVIYTRGTPETLTINGNAVTWGTHADKLANGFKLRTSSSSYNASGTNTWTATAPSNMQYPRNNAQGNP